MAVNQPTGYEHKVMELLSNLAEMLLKKQEPREPFADFPDLLHAEHIIEMTGWSNGHVYGIFKRPDFKLANGGEKPYCCLKVDFIDWLKREVP